MVTSEWIQRNSPWYAVALWHTSLILAIFALLCATQEQMLLIKMRIAFERAFSDHGTDKEGSRKYTLEDSSELERLSRFLFSAPEPCKSASRPTDEESGSVPNQNRIRSVNLSLDRKLSNQMMFLWQCPLLLMSYSWVLFIIALTLHVIQPPLGAWNNQAKVRASRNQRLPLKLTCLHSRWQ